MYHLQTPQLRSGTVPKYRQSTLYASTHLSRQLLPLRPGMPSATLDHLFTPCSLMSRRSIMSSCNYVQAHNLAVTKPQQAQVRRRTPSFCPCNVFTSCRQGPSVPFLLTIANRSLSEDKLCRQQSQRRKIAVQLQPLLFKGVSRTQTFQHCAQRNLRDLNQYKE